MNQSRSRLVDLAGLLSNVTALHTLFSIFAFRQTGRSDPAGLLIWCVCLSLTCGGLALFLRRPRTQRSVLLLALAALALQGAVVWLWGVRYPSLLSWLCLLAMWGFSYFRCYELLIRPTPAEQLMVSFETASLVLLAAALCTAAGVLPLDTALAPAAGTLLALAALAGQRASNSRPGGQAAGSLRGRLLLLLLLAALGGGAALCVLLFTGTAAQALTALTESCRIFRSAARAAGAMVFCRKAPGRELISPQSREEIAASDSPALPADFLRWLEETPCEPGEITSELFPNPGGGPDLEVTVLAPEESPEERIGCVMAARVPAGSEQTV